MKNNYNLQRFTDAQERDYTHGFGVVILIFTWLQS